MAARGEFSHTHELNESNCLIFSAGNCRRVQLVQLYNGVADVHVAVSNVSNTLQIDRR